MFTLTGGKLMSEMLLFSFLIFYQTPPGYLTFLFSFSVDLCETADVLLRLCVLLLAEGHIIAAEYH